MKCTCKEKLLNRKLKVENENLVDQFCKIIISPRLMGEIEFWIQCKACKQLFVDGSDNADYWILVLPSEEKINNFLITKLAGN